MYMKKRNLLLVLPILLFSCDGAKESPFCHKGIYIQNTSDIPIRICRVLGCVGCVSDKTVFFMSDDFMGDDFMSDDSDKKNIWPGDTAYLDIAGWKECLEDLLDWASSHPTANMPDLRTIYICDTIRPTQTYYSTIDSVLSSHHILKQISLTDTGVSKLESCNFILQYP